MTDLSLLFQNISFTYDRATQPIIGNLSVHFTRSWTGIVGANGVGKSTMWMNFIKLGITAAICHERFQRIAAA
jgi:ABC-type bacteriocin/lantibiotic exporter with double-glycine peptidase domain